MMAETITVRDDRVGRAMAWLTVERAAYAGLAVLATGVRLWGVGRAAFSPEEAAQALAAVSAVGGAQPDLAGLSPLLYTLQWATFTLAGATDASARFWTAFVGGLSVLLFFALRDRLTRGGALAAAFFWATSPLAVWTSRFGSGDSLVPPLALALIAGLNLFIADGKRRGLITAAVTLGLLLAAGGNAYTALLGMAVASLLLGFEFVGLLQGLREQRRGVLVGFLGAFAAGATFAFLSPTGLASAVALAGEWVQDVLPGAGEYAPWETVYRLVLSEFALLAFGVAGVFLALRRGDSFGLGVAVSGGVAWLVAIAGRGRHPADLALVALALAILAGPAAAQAARGVRYWWNDRDTWVFVGASIALLFAAMLAFPGAWNPTVREDWRAIYTGIFLATLSLFVVLWIAYGVWEGWSRVAHALPPVLLLFAIVWQISQLAGLSFDQAAWRQAGVLHRTAASDVRDFRATLRDVSALHRGGPDDARVDLVWPQRPDDPALPLLLWELRDFDSLRVSASLPEDAAPIVITPLEEQPRLASTYGGAEFPIVQSWRPLGLGGFDAVRRWVLFREARTVPEETRAILWFDRTSR